MIDTVRGLLGAGADDDVALLAADGGSLTFRQLRHEVDRLGERLRLFGLGSADRIAIVLPNGPQMAVAFLAAATTGCAAPLNPKYRTSELRFYLDDLGAAALITSADASGDQAREAASEAAKPVLSLLIEGELETGGFTLAAAGGSPGGAGVAAEGGTVEEDTGAAGVDEAGGAQPGPDDVALVLHTSGTTSRPKIVPLRQRNLASSAAGIADSLALVSGDRSLNVMPLFHIHGLLAGLLAPLSVGGSVVATPGFDAFAFFGWLRSLRPTYYTAVPTMHQMVIARSKRHRDEAKASGLRFVRSSSASLPAPVLVELAELFGVPVIEAYGMTEATHQMCANPLPPGVAKPRSVGLPTGIELGILDQQDRLLASGERGEVSIRGATVIDGYENNPEANAAAFTAGWFRTGDEGYVDDEGYLFLTGRLKEQINRGGEKISPLEVDEALLSHPEVAQAVTFSVPHPQLGEEVAAAVVLEPGSNTDEITAAELRRHVGESLAAFKVPRQVLILDELPKGPTGKLQRIGLATRLGLT